MYNICVFFTTLTTRSNATVMENVGIKCSEAYKACKQRYDRQYVRAFVSWFLKFTVTERNNMNRALYKGNVGLL